MISSMIRILDDKDKPQATMNDSSDYPATPEHPSMAGVESTSNPSISLVATNQPVSLSTDERNAHPQCATQLPSLRYDSATPQPPSLSVTCRNQVHNASIARENEQLKSRIAHLEAKVARLKDSLSHESGERRRRDAEVESLRLYAMANDLSQGSDVVSLIQNLNNTAFTFASELSLNWAFPEEKGPYRGERKLPALESALVQCRLDHHNARPLLQAAMQSCILRMAAKAMHQTSPGLDQCCEHLVRTLEQHVQESESQPTFGRWRATTYNSLSLHSSHDQKQHSQQLYRTVAAELHHLGMLLTGFALDREKCEELEVETRETMEDIISKSVQFAMMVRTKIISANYRHYRPTEQPFDDARMDIPHFLTKPSRDDKVMATVRLGVLRHERVGRKAVDGVDDRTDVMLKAQVLTDREIGAMVRDATFPTAEESNVSTSQQTSLGSRILTKSTDWVRGWL